MLKHSLFALQPEVFALKQNLSRIQPEIFRLQHFLRARVKFGKNSTQYEQAGGTRTSERKTPTRKSKALVPA